MKKFQNVYVHYLSTSNRELPDHPCHMKFRTMLLELGNHIKYF